MSGMLVFDIGKTHIKLVVLDEQYRALASYSSGNKVVVDGIYPHADEEGIWQWFVSTVKQITIEHKIAKVSITTHGATAALINTSDANHKDNKAKGLVMPIMDYEFSGLDDDQVINNKYGHLRPDFEQSLSPELPAGLNLGKQLFWQQQRFPEQFEQADAILMYPQYWVWKLTGKICSEVTSLGCHTDLWDPGLNQWSSLVTQQHWHHLFPAIVPAWHSVGAISEDVAELTGLAQTCTVVAGLHDSNASLVPHKLANGDKPFTIVSTGTWSIVMASGVDLSMLKEAQDMLANVDLTSKPIACARFMGGREYETICRLTQSPLNVSIEDDDIFELAQQYIDNNVMAVPSFSNEGGPFKQNKGIIVGDVASGKGAILASMYCAMMLDLQLTNLASQGDIVIEGAFIKNDLICQFLSQLRAPQKVFVSQDNTGTVVGAAKLCNWDNLNEETINKRRCEATNFKGVQDYKMAWLSAAVGKHNT